ncbi:MAG: sensor histidine kinase [Planctomycetaceae bacterium]
MHRRSAIFRVLAPLAIVSGLLLAIGIAGAWRVHRLQRHASDALAVHVSSIRAAEKLDAAVRDIDAELSLFLVTGDQSHLQAVPSLLTATERWLAEAEKWATTDDERKLVAEIQAGRSHLVAELDRLSTAGRGDDRLAVARNLVLTVIPEQIRAQADRYLNYNESELARNSAEIQNMAERSVFGLVLLGACGCVAGLVSGYGLARQLHQYLQRLTVPIRNVAGRLNSVSQPLTLPAAPGLDELEHIMHGVTDRVDAVIDRWKQTERDAMRAEKLAAVGQLAAGLAHELRNPLMSMKILLQAATEQGEHGSLSGRDLRVFEDETDRLEGLVQSFLDFARPPAPHKIPLSLQSLITQTVELAAVQAHRRGAFIETQLPHEPVMATVDPGQMRQLFLNLLLNGLDAVQIGGEVEICLEVCLAGDPPDQPQAGITVRDNGRGLPLELGERIFEPFVSTKPTGVGLGLPICRRIVDAHGGSIEARSRLEGGAEVVVALPLAPLAAPDRGAGFAAPQSAGSR